MFYFFAVIILGLIALIIWNSLTQPGVGDLKGDFKAVAFYRNENNTGPIVRVYAVTTVDTLWEEMEKYGAFMPHSKYGNTKVYFFQKGKAFPRQLIPGEHNFDEELKPYCMAVYEKNAMGQVSFIKWPYSQRSSD